LRGYSKSVITSRINKYRRSNVILIIPGHRIQLKGKGINTLLGKNHSTLTLKNINYNNIDHSTPEEISSALNHHFTEVGHKLASQLPPSSRHFSDYISPSIKALV
jgi:hypothetical protein